ncbi:copper resistance D family protein [Bacillus sp. Marseille-P3800]|uniref:copper resistance D family protein n=1 Tax=Bacillus sp. Marseille-P3800 TaxID=2014782 RepID=UPI000C0689FB|nr:CopD family protein [Bacillus sp. Marseille-P3800]
MLEIVLNSFMYTCLALLAGLIIIQMVPTERGLDRVIPNRFMLIVTMFIPLIQLGYLIGLGRTYANFFSISLLDGIVTAMGEHILGTSFFLVLLFAVLILILIIFSQKLNRFIRSGLQFILFLGIIFAVSLSSHSASLTDGYASGAISNAIHLLSMALWTGPLFIVSLYAKHLTNGKKFHQWFSALAVFSLLLVSTSGFVMMGEIAPEYVNSWMLTYGQLLVIKHILIAPLLIFGFRHLLALSGKGASLSIEEKQRSFRFESIFVLAVFIVTAMLTESEPPHNVLRTLQNEPFSPIMNAFLTEPLMENQLIAFSPSVWSGLLLGAAVFLFFGGLFVAWWFKRTWVTVTVSIAFVLSFYVGLMTSTGPGDIPVNLTVHETVEEAINVNREDEELEPITTWPLTDESFAVIFMENERHLVAERLKEEPDGYRKYLDAEVEIENGFLTGGDQFMDTFMFIENDWVDVETISTYVSLGYVTEEIEDVRIHFSHETVEVPVEDHVFLYVQSMNQTLEEAHEYELLDANGNVVRTVEKRQFVHEGHVH